MNAQHDSWPTRLSPLALASLAGAAATLAGCALNRDQTPTVAAAPQPVPAAQPVPMKSPRVAAAERQGRQFDPFWIEAAAEADKSLWLGMPADPTGPTASGSELLADQTMTLGTPADPHSAAAGADAVESLTHVTFAAEGADLNPCISRDGTFMVFASTQHRPTADIYYKSIDGRTITQLTSDPAHDLMPAISPDGTRVAFASNRTGNWDIYLMASTGGQAVQLTGDNSQDVSPSWSPDGKRLVFSRFGEMSGRWEMWVMDVQASASAEFLGYGLFPKWCPRAATGTMARDKILFQRSRERGDRAFSLWTIDYKPGDASSPTEIAASPTAALINADWAPDGERVVYASVENPGTSAAAAYQTAVADLWMTSIDGSGRVNLTNGRFMNLMPAWGKDNRIYFVSNRGGSTNIWSVGTDKAIYAAGGRSTRPANPAQPQDPAASEMATVPSEPATETPGEH